MVDANTYETSDWNEDWIPYPGEVTVHVHFPPGITRAPVSVDAYVGTCAGTGGPCAAGVSPNGGPDFQAGDVWTSATGLLAEVVFLDQTGFYVTNASCAAYYARFVVDFAPAELALFGGLGASADGGAATLDDTWSWNGVGWADQGSAPSAGPEPRERATLGTVNASPFLYGGFDDDNQTYLVDSWTWNGVAWAQAYSATYPWPTARADAASAVIDDLARALRRAWPGPDEWHRGRLRRHVGLEWNQLDAAGGRCWARARPAVGRVRRCVRRPYAALRRQRKRDAARRHVGVGWIDLGADHHSRSEPALPRRRRVPGLRGAALRGDAAAATSRTRGSGTARRGPPRTSLARAPAPRLPSARSRAAALLFGGNQAEGTFSSDTWTWGAGRWTQQASGPSPRAGAMAAGL